MGRSPCCDKAGVKKGPWTPEEDIVLVTYIQEHGPGNWRAVPANTGLRRCSKSCRLRWSNYLRPGIKRGNFTEKEEKLIIHLQALLGNRWAAIASYLPERTDNDIKNYWNTHLRRKLSKQQFYGDGNTSSPCRSVEKGQWERRLQTDIHMAKQALREALSLEITPTFMSKNSLPSSALTAASNSSPSAQSEDIHGYRCLHAPLSSPMNPYASHAENISRLLQGWATNYNDVRKPAGESSSLSTTQHSANTCDSSSGEDGGSFANDRTVRTQALDSQLGFERRAVTPSDGASRCSFVEEESCGAPFSMLETWLLGDGAGQAGQETFMDDMALDSTA